MNISEIIDETLEYLGYNRLRGIIKVSFNKRLRTTIGLAYYPTKSIELNPYFWEVASRERQIEVLHHEVCHIMNASDYVNNFKKFNRADYVSTGGHERNWMDLMNQLDYKNPSPFCKISSTQYNSHYIFTCHKCNYSVSCSTRKGNTYKNNPYSHGNCPNCRTLINFSNFKYVDRKDLINV